MNSQHREFIAQAELAAEVAGHLFPTGGACEAALESGFGTSLLATADNNLFGMKQHKHPIYGTHNLPTKEFIDSDNDGDKEWVVVNAAWVKYPDWAACFKDRLDTLKRLAPVYSHYAKALAAKDVETFITEVSQTWSTDPKRASKILSIRKDYLGL